MDSGSYPMEIILAWSNLVALISTDHKEFFFKRSYDRVPLLIIRK